MAAPSSEDIRELTEALKAQTAAIVDAQSASGGGAGGSGAGAAGFRGLTGGSVNQFMSAADTMATAMAALAISMGALSPGMATLGEDVTAAADSIRTLMRGPQMIQGAAADVVSMLAPFAMAGINIPEETIASGARMAMRRTAAVTDLQLRAETYAALELPARFGLARSGGGTSPPGSPRTGMQRAFDQVLDTANALGLGD